MPRAPFDFTPHAAAILEYRRLGWDASEILTALRLSPTKWTLNRWLAKHSPDTTKYKLTKDVHLIAFIKQEWSRNQSHEQILDKVNREYRPKGGDITSRQLKVLRHGEGLVFRRRGGLREDYGGKREGLFTSVVFVDGSSDGATVEEGVNVAGVCEVHHNMNDRNGNEGA